MQTINGERKINFSLRERQHIWKTNEKCEKLPIRLETSDDYQSMCGQSDKWNNRCLDENVKLTQVDTEWNDINEVIESDFLISPGDIYPNHKVELQDATIMDETRRSFADICMRKHSVKRTKT